MAEDFSVQDYSVEMRVALSSLIKGELNGYASERKPEVLSKIGKLIAKGTNELRACNDAIRELYSELLIDALELGGTGMMNSIMVGGFRVTLKDGKPFVNSQAVNRANELIKLLASAFSILAVERATIDAMEKKTDAYEKQVAVTKTYSALIEKEAKRIAKALKPVDTSFLKKMGY